MYTLYSIIVVFWLLLVFNFAIFTYLMLLKLKEVICILSACLVGSAVCSSWTAFHLALHSCILLLSGLSCCTLHNYFHIHGTVLVDGWNHNICIYIWGVTIGAALVYWCKAVILAWCADSVYALQMTCVIIWHQTLHCLLNFLAWLLETFAPLLFGHML